MAGAIFRRGPCRRDAEAAHASATDLITSGGHHPSPFAIRPARLPSRSPLRSRTSAPLTGTEVMHNRRAAIEQRLSGERPSVPSRPAGPANSGILRFCAFATALFIIH